jgi:hypothetical protein
MEEDEEHGMWKKNIIWSEKKKNIQEVFVFFNLKVRIRFLAFKSNLYFQKLKNWC